MIIFILTIICILISVFGDVMDGISNVKKDVGWLQSHFLNWLRRDISIIIILICIFLLNWKMFLIISPLIGIIKAQNRRIMRYCKDNIDKFAGDKSMPKWFENFRKLWGWLS